MNKTLLSVAAILSLSACVGEPQPTQQSPAADKQIYTVACGAIPGWSACDSRASKVCSGGYDVVSTSGSLPYQDHTLTVTCRQ